MKRIKKLLLEIIPVVIGVFLAMILNGLISKASDKRYFKTSLKALIEENQQNIDELDYALSRQKAYSDTLRIYFMSDTISLFEITQKAKGFYTPDLKLTSWKFLLEDSKHTLIPIEMINRLTDIEKYHHGVVLRSEIVQQQFYKESFFDKKATKMPMVVLTADLKGDQQALLKVMKEFSDYLKEKGY